MFTKRFLMGTIFASAIAWPAAARAASWHQFTTGSGACSQIAAGDGTSPWCLAQDIENGQYEIYWFDTHNNTWEDSLSAGVQLSVAYQCPGGVDYCVNIPIWLSKFGGINGSGSNIYYGIPQLLAPPHPSLYPDIDGSDVASIAFGSISTGCGNWVAGAGFNALALGCSGENSYDLFYSTATYESIDDNPYLSWTSWTEASPTGGGIRLSASQDNGQAWIATNGGSIYCESEGFVFNSGEGSWYNVTPSGVSATYVSAGGTSTSQAWMIDSSGKLWRYNSPDSGTYGYCYDYMNETLGTWTHITNNTGDSYPDNHATSVSVGQNGTVWVTDITGDIWQYY